MYFEQRSDFLKETALVLGDLRLTFAEVSLHVNCLARGLLNTGFGKSDRIAVMLNNCVEYALLLAACSRIGLIAVCLNTRTSADEIRMVLENIFLEYWKMPEATVYAQRNS